MISTKAPVQALATCTGRNARELLKISTVSEVSGPPQEPYPTSSWLPNAVSSNGAVSPPALAIATRTPVVPPATPPPPATPLIVPHLPIPPPHSATPTIAP